METEKYNSFKICMILGYDNRNSLSKNGGKELSAFEFGDITKLTP
jgi:hypothetical protein